MYKFGVICGIISFIAFISIILFGPCIISAVLWIVGMLIYIHIAMPRPPGGVI